MYSHHSGKTGKAGCLGLILTVAVGFSLLACISHAEPLSVHPTNPRYFMNDSGDAVYMTGSHVWYNIHTNTRDTSPENSYQDMQDYLDFMQSHGHNFVRLWTGWATGFGPFPWQRTGPGTATDGLPQFDMTQFNQTYFDTVKQWVQELDSRGMYCSVMFYGSGIAFGTSGWTNMVWNENNNINPELDSFSSTDGTSFFSPTSQALEIQRMTVRKFIDELNNEDNIMWEIVNEAPSEGNDWQHQMVDYVISYESTKPKQHLVGMTGGGSGGQGNELLIGSHNWFSPDGGLPDYYYGGPADYINKIVISDTDHIRNPSNTGWGFSELEFVPAMVIWVWETFTRGNHPIFMDWYDSYDSNPDYGQTSGTINPEYDPVREAMGYTLDYADRFADLASMVPSETISSTDYCLANPGSEYLIYQPGSGSFSVNLVAGEYGYEWFNPDTGSVAGTGTITATGGSQNFNPPFSGDAVLYIFTGSESCSDLNGVDCCILPDTCPGTDFGTTWDCSGTCCSQPCFTPEPYCGDTYCNGDETCSSCSSDCGSCTTELIIDNGDSGTSYTGTWAVSSGANPYGTESLTTMDAGETYQWQGLVSGTNEVYLWWTYWASRCTSVPVQIYDGSTLLDTVTVSHQENAGQWNLLGTYTFTGTGRVRLPTTSDSCSTCADAVRFLPVIQACTDVDEDGYGSPASPLCTHPEMDCNDNNPDVNPGVTEVCDNSRDDDCDGQQDCLDAGCFTYPSCMTCQNQGYSCCDPDSCQGPRSVYDTDCPGSQVCCDECENPPVDCTGLVMLLHMDNDPDYGETPTHVFDFSGNGNNGTVQGAAHTSGIFDGAFEFLGDGFDDLITTPHSSSLSITSELTLAAWIKPGSFSNQQRVLHKKQTTSYSAYGMYIDDLPAGSIQFRTTDCGDYFEDARSTGAVAAAEFSFVVVTFDDASDTVIFYINGQESGTTTGFENTMCQTNTEALEIGGVEGRSDRQFDGTIDEVAIWNRALSADEVQELYDSSAPISCGQICVHQADKLPCNGRVDMQELVDFVDLWKYDSTAYTMSEMMEAVVLYYSP